MTTIDCKAIFSLQEQIIESANLTAEQKLAMLLASIKKTLGEEKQDEKTN